MKDREFNKDIEDAFKALDKLRNQYDKLKEANNEMKVFLTEFVEAIESEEIIIHENLDNDGWENKGGRLYENAKKLIK